MIEQAKDNKHIYFILFFIFGFIVMSTTIIAPLHEYFHVACARLDGVTTEITSWTSVVFSAKTPQGLYGAYLGEFVLAMVLMTVLRRFTGAGYFFGYAHAIYFKALGSKDYNSHALRMYNGNQGKVDQVLIAWGIVLGIVLLIIWGVLIKNWQKGRENEQV